MINNIKESYFDGGLLSYIGHQILAFLITVCTLGICAPWGICIMINWKVKHTVIDGRRLYFDGTASQLFGNWVNGYCLQQLLLAFIHFGYISKYNNG